ncbi:hypothetical protein F5Y19DRAFT_458738 [Xylariaceae sp. FL1651]|nr:hypothetical protein F5Y19DRAFT_458738 [Xylariaceae sp. FL1651]
MMRRRNLISLSLSLFLPTSHRASSSYSYADPRQALRLAIDGRPVGHTASRCGFIKCTKIRVLFDRDTRVLLSALAISPPSSHLGLHLAQLRLPCRLRGNCGKRMVL